MSEVRHKRSCPKCKGEGFIKVRRKPEELPTVCYDHWDYYDYYPCDEPNMERK